MSRVLFAESRRFSIRKHHKSSTTFFKDRQKGAKNGWWKIWKKHAKNAAKQESSWCQCCLQGGKKPKFSIFDYTFCFVLKFQLKRTPKITKKYYRRFFFMLFFFYYRKKRTKSYLKNSKIHFAKKYWKLWLHCCRKYTQIKTSKKDESNKRLQARSKEFFSEFTEFES